MIKLPDRQRKLFIWFIITLEWNQKKRQSIDLWIKTQKWAVITLNIYKRFSIKQIRSLVLLTKILKKKYNIKSKNFLGHSDIAPNRKVDPGEKFPWQYLAKHKIGIWHNFIKKDSTFKGAEVSKKDQWLFYMYLRKIGYCCKGKQAKYMKFIIKAFQRRYRPKKINGKIDQESLVIAKNLVKRGLN